MFLSNILNYVQNMNEATGASQKVFGIIEAQSKLDITSSDGRIPDYSSGKIEFRNVTFAYPSRPDATILKDFSLTIQAGQTGSQLIYIKSFHQKLLLLVQVAVENLQFYNS